MSVKSQSLVLIFPSSNLLQIAAIYFWMENEKEVRKIINREIMLQSKFE